MDHASGGRCRPTCILLMHHRGQALNAIKSGWLGGPTMSSPNPDAYTGKALLLASEGRKFTPEAIALAAQLAKSSGAVVHVLSIARVWGTAFGMPHPGLMPSKSELQAQHDIVAEAVSRLRKQGIEATGQVLGTRGAGKRIVREADQRGCDAIVMAADRPRHWLIADFIWSQEPHRVRRLARIPVYLTS